MQKITGRCIWIIGASSGLGRALALMLADAGNFVIASARSTDALNELALLRPGKIKAFPLDISEGMDLKATSQQLHELTDFLDMVIYASGVCEYEDNQRFSPDLYQRMLDINFLGAVRIFNVALPLFKRSQMRPHFVAVSSLSTCVGFPRAEAYGASKAALNYFMQSLRADYSKTNIDFSLVRPGFIATNLVRNNDFSMPLLMTPAEASQRIIKGIAKRKFLIDFPARLSWALRLSSLFFNSWCKWIAPKITRIHSY